MNLGIDLKLTRTEAEAVVKAMADRSQATELEWQTLRQALLELQEHSEFQIFGICASNSAIAGQSLRQYLTAFEYEYPDFSKHQLLQPVYWKYNSRNRQLYSDAYSGKYEGVLISYHSNFSEDYSGTHGHFPLALWQQNFKVVLNE
ncbi:MAG: DUF1824 family protein [Pseudanabaenaceae cyanobacterium bins.68]|nr:DUF1824 family protein [Pseudanabaenaceae cyanobacterium bins.68]